MKRHLCLLAALPLTVALAVAEEPPAPTPADDLGLAKGSVFDVLVPDPVAPETSDPGDKPRLPRDYEGSPPRVPHAVDDYLPVTREDNLCVDCHGIAEAEEGDPTAIPASHYTDLRRAPDRVGEALAGARWVCLSCHVVPTDAEPLVRNLFVRPGPAAIGDEKPR
ncbi:MAG: nitrate reductase cytochrome c-type subunit [Thermoanaerobaculia bacterium]